MAVSSVALALCAVFSACFTLSLAAPEYRLFFGIVQGVDKLAEGTNTPYYAYYGIPFAQPPIGDLRFKAPERYRGSGPNNIVTSDRPRAACMQRANDPSYVVSEDCLHLNVYAPVGASQANLKKVMVFIYGGGFMSGDTYRYTPSRMVTENDVIVVTFNYRVGVYGFLSHGEGSGNYGLYDQIAALQWVRENIGTFGGDPNDVTIYSKSAGSVSASILSISPKAKGLFSKVILQSGTAFMSIKEQTGRQFDKLTRASGCAPWFYASWLRSQFADTITNCLRRLGSQALTRSAFSLASFSRGPPKFASAIGQESDFLFSPSVDGEILPKHPALLMADRNYLQEVGALDRSYIIGFNNNEGLFYVEMFLDSRGNLSSINEVQNAEKNVDDVLDDFFHLRTPPEFKSVVNFEYLYPRIDGKPPLKQVISLVGDYSFVLPSIKFARMIKAAHNQTKVFMYLFDHNPTEKNPSLGITGTSHAMELAYLFDYADYSKYLAKYDYYTTIPDPGQSDANLYRVVMGALTQFAKTGSPSGYLGTGQSDSWPEYDTNEEFYLSISTTPTVRQHVYAKRMSLWTQFMRS